MATEKRLIDANGLVRKVNKLDVFYFTGETDIQVHDCQMVVLGEVLAKIDETPTVDAVEVPCKIGDFVWAIRNFKGKKHPQRGIVSDMYFLKDMSLQIVVKYVARGEWGKTVFATDKEAYAAIGERKNNV